MTGEVNTWVASEASNWNVDANWSLGHVPTATETAIFDNTSDNNCAVNAAPDVLGINLATGYDGTVTQGAVDIILGTDGYAQAAGTFTGEATQTITNAGNFSHTTGTFTSNKSSLIFTTDGSTISTTLSATSSLRLLRASANITVSSSFEAVKLTVDANKTLTIANGITLGYQAYGTDTYAYANSGAIAGTGTLKLKLYNANKAVTFGTVSCPVLISTYSTPTGSYSCTLGAATTLGSTLTIQSAHATETCTLDMAAKTLSATAITTGDRGILTNSGAAAACTTPGAFTVSGASSVVSGAIALDCGSFAQSDGTVTLDTTWITCAGNFNNAAGTITAWTLKLRMTGDGVSISKTIMNCIELDIQGKVTISEDFLVNDKLTVGDGKMLAIANGTTLYIYNGAVAVSSLAGTITGGTGGLTFYIADLSQTVCPLNSVSLNIDVSFILVAGATENRTSTLSTDIVSAKGLTITSLHASNTMTLDSDGHSANISGAVTIGTRGVLLGGEGVHHFAGDFDSSAGTWTPETCQVIFTKAATVTLAAGQSFYDLISYAYPITLGADLVVSNIFAHVGPVIPGAFALTMTDPTKEYTGMRRPILRNLRTPIGLPPCCRPLLDGIERVST